MKKNLRLLLALLILIGGWNCKKEGEDAPAPSFTITNLQYTPTTATIRSHLPSFAVTGTVSFSDAQNGISQFRMQTSAGADLSVPVQGISQAAGILSGIFEVAMPAQAGAYTFDLWLVDGAGRSSNKLNGSLTMTISDAATNWEITSQQYGLHQVSWGNSKYLAVGENGTIVTSANGGTWTAQASGTTHTLYGACWTGTQWVVVGNNHTILTSPNGTAWMGRGAASSSIQLNDVAGSTNHLVAVGWDATTNSSVILNSTDGVTWAPNDFSVIGGELTGITWSGTRYVAVGKAFGYPLILSSPNGVDWTNRSGLFDVQGHLARVVWSGDQFVATGYACMATSADGLTWNVYNNPDFSAAGITWSGSKFVTAGLTGIHTSTDGVTWTKAYEAPYPLRSIAWSGTQYVAVGIISPVIMVSP